MTLLLLALAAPPAEASCTTFVDDDLTDGDADGDVYGGRFSAAGWEPDGATLVYNFPSPVDRGSFTITVAGLEEAGLSQTDLAEMFTAWDGSFSDGERHSFLQLKMAGDVYDGYAGRIKMHIGGEYGDMELAEWSDMRDWHPADVHEIRVTWGDGRVTMDHDGDRVADVDYSSYNGGFVPFETLRVPNDGRYAYDPVMGELRYLGVEVCGEASAPPEPPTVRSFDVQPRELAQYELFTLAWSVAGDVTDLQACGQSRSTAEVLCAPLDGLDGRLDVGAEVLAVGTWDVWLAASGPGGAAESARVPLVVHEAGWVPSEEPVDTGAPGDDGEDPGDSGDPPPADSGAPDPEPGVSAPVGEMACSCSTGGGAVAPALGLLGALALLRRAGPRRRPLG